MNKAKDDRREFVRFNFDANIKFRTLDRTEEIVKSKAKNLSADGVCIVTDKPLGHNKDLELDIFLPGRKKVLRVSGNVVWSCKVKNGLRKNESRFEAGLKLYTVDRDDENTLLRYYCEKVTDNLAQYINL